MSPEMRARIEAEWLEEVAFYRRRAAVVFYSDERFWDAHGFVQQSLARTLVAAGVEVRWIDGSGWRRYEPVVGTPSPLLRVGQMLSLPGRRFVLFDRVNVHLQWRWLRRALRTGGNPLFWVQGGLDERLAAALPAADVYSVFDDPYSHSLQGALCRSARLILCQNSHATRLFQSGHAGKAHLALPPMDFENVRYAEGVFTPPPGFPKRLMGYVGSFFFAGFDFALLEHFIRTLPDWGFVLMGRSDAEGDRRCEELASHKNFLRLPWAPRAETARVWRSLAVSLLLYPRLAQQDGAFATKAIESFHFGVPCVGTAVPKTADLSAAATVSTTPDALVAAALVLAEMEREPILAEGARLQAKTDPRAYLTRVGRWLKA